MNKQIANKILWVEYWIEHMGPSQTKAEINSNKVGNKWISEITLPTINKTVVSASKTEVGAMLRTASKASTLIDEYMKKHQDIKINNIFKGKPYYIEYDDEGNFVYIGLTKEYREKTGKQLEKMMLDSLSAVRKAVDKIKKIYGTSDGLSIQVIDKKLFKDNDIKSLNGKLIEKMEKDYGCDYMNRSSVIYGDSVIVIGYTSPRN